MLLEPTLATGGHGVAVGVEREERLGPPFEHLASGAVVDGGGVVRGGNASMVSRSDGYKMPPLTPTIWPVV